MRSPLRMTDVTRPGGGAQLSRPLPPIAVILSLAVDATDSTLREFNLA